MRIVDAETFTAAREQLDPIALAGIPQSYERYWLAEDSPYEGSIICALFEHHAEVVARIAILLPKDSQQANFCFYGRRADLSEAQVAAVLRDLVQWLELNQTQTLEGPVEFSTWNANRFVSKQGDYPWFDGEQSMPEYHFHDFIAAGFHTSAQYVSSLVDDLKYSIEVGLSYGVDKAVSQMDIRYFCGEEIITMLPELYDLSAQVFADNYLYTAISYEQFCQLYTPVLDRDCVVILASIEERPVGLAFSYATGHFGLETGSEKQKTAVLKTIGVHPSARQQHVGIGVSYLTHKFWLERGYQRIIHAYMKANNVSSKMSDTYAHDFREYALVKWSGR